MFASIHPSASGDSPYQQLINDAPWFPGQPVVDAFPSANVPADGRQRLFGSPSVMRWDRDPYLYISPRRNQNDQPRGFSPGIWPENRLPQRRGAVEYRVPDEDLTPLSHDERPVRNPDWLRRPSEAAFKVPAYRYVASTQVQPALNPERDDGQIRNRTLGPFIPHAFQVPEEEYFEHPRAVPAVAPHVVPFKDQHITRNREVDPKHLIPFDTRHMGFVTPKAASEIYKEREAPPKHVPASEGRNPELIRSIKAGLSDLKNNQIAGAATSERLATGVERIATVLEHLQTRVPSTSQTEITVITLESRIEELEDHLLDLRRKFRHHGHCARTNYSFGGSSDEQDEDCEDESYETGGTITDQARKQESDRNKSTASETDAVPVPQKRCLVRQNADRQPRVETDAEDSCEVPLYMERSEGKTRPYSGNHLKKAYQKYDKSFDVKGKKKADRGVSACF